MAESDDYVRNITLEMLNCTGFIPTAHSANGGVNHLKSMKTLKTQNHHSVTNSDLFLPYLILNDIATDSHNVTHSTQEKFLNTSAYSNMAVRFFFLNNNWVINSTEVISHRLSFPGTLEHPTPTEFQGDVITSSTFENISLHSGCIPNMI